MSCSTYDISFSSLTSKNSVEPSAHESPTCFRFFSLILTFPFVVRGQNVASRCQDAARMFFVSEMFLVKASRPTRCHLLSLSCHVPLLLRSLSRPPFSLSLVSFRFLAFYPQSLPWILRQFAVLSFRDLQSTQGCTGQPKPQIPSINPAR